MAAERETNASIKYLSVNCFRRRINKKFYHCSCFVNIFPLKMALPFIWTKGNSQPPRMLCAKFGWNWPSGSCEDDFQMLSMYFCYFVIISPRKRACPFIWTNLNPHPLRMLCSKFSWNWPFGSGVRRWKCGKFTDRQTDDRRLERLAWAFTHVS